jgi:alginate O-acetyltransferase complex protein AlgI
MTTVTLCGLGAWLVATLGLAYAVTWLRPLALARGAAWGLVASVLGVERLLAEAPPVVRMLGFIAALFLAMKAVVLVEWRARQGARLSPLRYLAFAVGWPGMRPELFSRVGGPPLPGSGRLCVRGAVHLLLGTGLLAAARVAWRESHSTVLAAALLLPGLSLVLHFGLLNLAAGLWRRAGVDCDPLFRAPLLSRSLREFWGRRWNRAFSEMTAASVYRPLASVAGQPAALLAAFLCSGLFHELAISVPVRAGFGGPLLYFALHGGLLLAETALAEAGYAVDRRAWIGRTWTAVCVLAPLPLLFHAAFLRGVAWPLGGL